MMRALTSASNIHRRALCAGSERMETGLPEEDNEQSREGTLLHAYASNPKLDRAVLKSGQRDLLETADRCDEFVFQRIREQFQINEDEPLEEGFERELMALNCEESETPGHCDRWRYWPGLKLLCVIDWKFGYNIVSPAAANRQLRVYAIGGYEEWKVDNCVVAIVQPRLSFEERVTMAAYNVTDITSSAFELKSIRAACLESDAPLLPGEEQCRYCKAALQLKCPAFLSKIDQGRALIPITEGTVAKREQDAQEIISHCSDEQLDQIIQGVRFAEFIHDTAMDEGRLRVGREGFPYTLGKASEKRAITDPARAIALLTLKGDLSRDDILNCSKPSLTKITEKLREKTKCTWKKANELINSTLSSVIVLEEKKPSLIRNK